MELVLVLDQAVHANVETVTLENIVPSHHVKTIAMEEELVSLANVTAIPVSHLQYKS